MKCITGSRCHVFLVLDGMCAISITATFQTLVNIELESVARSCRRCEMLLHLRKASIFWVELLPIKKQDIFLSLLESSSLM